MNYEKYEFLLDVVLVVAGVSILFYIAYSYWR